MKFPSLLSTRFRGFRVVNLLGLTVLLVIALGSYALKTLASVQDAGAAGIEDQIVLEQKRIRMLKAEVATLGAPDRVAELSRRYLAAVPVDPAHDVPLAALPAIAAQSKASAAPANAVVAP